MVNASMTTSLCNKTGPSLAFMISIATFRNLLSPHGEESLSAAAECAVITQRKKMGFAGLMVLDYWDVYCELILCLRIIEYGYGHTSVRG